MSTGPGAQVETLKFDGGGWHCSELETVGGKPYSMS